jgi:uncharacterized protein (DUF885 family)
VNRRSFVQRTAVTTAGFGILRNVQACAPPAAPPPPPPAIIPGTLTELRDRYFVFHLERNPVTSTYLGGDAYSPSLADSNSRLRDYRVGALTQELAFHRSILASVEQVDPATLTDAEKSDRGLMMSQLEFLIRQGGEKRYWERSLDTYVAEPFRGVDWQIQQMREYPGGLIGDEPEWQHVVARTLAVPGYLEVARGNLLAGKKSGNIPDKRMVQRDGIEGSRANAGYFRETLPGLAHRYLGSRSFAPLTLAQVTAAGLEAASAWEQFAAFLLQNFDVNEPVDRYHAGEEEYEWRVRTVLRDSRTAAELYEYGAAQVALYTARIVEVAREFADTARMNIPFGTPASNYSGVKAVMDFLSKDAPRDDDQLFRWYREAGIRSVAYGREHDLFDIPAEYRLDVLATPPVLRSTIDAAYYPAPALKQGGTGRFYLTPTGNDPEALRSNNFASVATTAVHEGFPGHDWHFKYMPANAEGTATSRWLTPGADEDSSAMWSDSMALEGWALYSEELMSEPVPDHRYGFYSAGEYLYELQAQLLRAVRIRVDVGLHTQRMTFDQAIDYYTEHVQFMPGARLSAAFDPAARAALESANRAIYRYSKWPTQAITYNLGKNAIIELREACRARTGSGFSAKRFHERFMAEGPIPVAFIREAFLEGCA